MHDPAPQRPGATDGAGPLTDLERTVLVAMLAGDGENFAALRMQLVRATVLSRTHSGVGFVTRLGLPDEVPAVSETALPRLKPVHALHPGLSESAQFLLQLRGGRLAVLEAYCFEGAWPADESDFRVVG
ncbi:MAG: hypothetical protein ABI661_06545 [Gammaproteobacteria bacterium]